MRITYICTDGLKDTVTRRHRVALVDRGPPHTNEGHTALELTDTGNGFIAKFAAKNCTEQDDYKCFDYSQARDLVLALSMFKKDLGFNEGAP